MRAPTLGPTRVGIGLVVLLLWSAACRIGNLPPSSSAVARSPQGASVRIDWRQTNTMYWSNSAELLAVSDSGLYLLHSGRSMVFYPYGLNVRLRPRDVPGVGSIDLMGGSASAFSLADYARYPFGLDDEGVRSLLDALGQDSVAVARSP